MDNILIEFIKNRPALNILKIAKAAEFSPTLLYGVLSGEKNLKGDKAFKLAKALSHYGLQLNGWIFKPYEKEDLNYLFAHRFTDDEQIDFEEEKGVIKYNVIIQRSVMDQFNFAQFIEVDF